MKTKILGMLAVVLLAALGWALATTPILAGPSGDNWLSAGGNRTNTRHQETEHKLSPSTASDLSVRWVFNTDGDVSATPAVDQESVYVPDWGGNLWAVDRHTGAPAWQVIISAVTGVHLDKARATPVIAGDKVILGTQGSILVAGGAPGGKLLAFDKGTGALLWATQLDEHPAAIVTQSATVHDGRVYVGVSSLEETLAAVVPGYTCCSFRGSMLAVDLETGAIVWQAYMAPEGYSGNALWGSAPAIDAKRGQVYVATGNNYSVPDEVEACVLAAGDDADAISACNAPDNLFDSVVALDLKTGAVRWATKALPADTWIASCIGFGDPATCPVPTGPNYDFGQAPALFTVKAKGTGQPRDLVGTGQKSGQYWALDPDTGAVVWVTQAGPGGTVGGLQWGSAVDGQRVYTADSNSNAKSWTLPDGSVTTRGVWSSLDAATGEVLWQRATPTPASDIVPGGWGDTSGPVTTANGVVFSCSVGLSGLMYALSAVTGEVLWSFASGGSCISGAAISNGHVFWGSGYSNFGLGSPNNKLYAFSLPD